mgnify:FL=1
MLPMMNHDPLYPWVKTYTPQPKPATIERVRCPVCTSAKGIIELPISLITAIAEAVYEPLEWAIILEGQRIAANHLRIHDWHFPPQTRRATTVDLDDYELTPTTIGVIHSHHSMQASFSGTDINELNPFFPVSIVVAQNKYSAPTTTTETEKQFSERIFGWTYSAVGGATLPCGSIGEIPYSVVPYDDEDGCQIEDWNYEPKLDIPVTAPASITSTCVSYTNDTQAGFVERITTACGMVSAPIPARAYWGRSSEIVDEISKHDAKQRKSLSSITRPLTIIPTQTIIPSSDALRRWNTIIEVARMINRQQISGISVPTKNFSIRGLSALVNKLRIDPELVTKSDISTPIAMWLELVLDFDTPLAPDEVLQLLQKPELPDELLVQLHLFNTLANSIQQA